MSSQPASSQGGASEIITGPAAKAIQEHQAGQQAKAGEGEWDGKTLCTI